MIVMAGGQEMVTIFDEIEDKKDNMVSFCYWFLSLIPNKNESITQSCKLPSGIFCSGPNTVVDT